MMLSLLPLAALAQVPAPDVNAAVVRTVVDSRAGLVTDDATVHDLGHSSARLSTHWMHGPIGAVDAEGAELQGIDHAVGLDLAGALYFRYARFGAHVPVYGLVTSDLWRGGPGLGDVSLDAKVVIVDPTDAGVGIGLVTALAFPTSTLRHSAIGHGAVSWRAAAVVDVRQGPLQLAGNLGTMVVPSVAVSNVDFDDALYTRFLVGYDLFDGAGATVEVAAQMPYKGGFGNVEGMPAELLVGGWWRAGRAVVLRAGLGTGLTGGIGSPAARGILSLSFEPPRRVDLDDDGIIDANDACPALAEDKDGFEDDDGCPEDDNDRDGVSDAVDACPLQPEEYDRIEDDDGCPDVATWLTVNTALGPGRPITNVDMTLTRDTTSISLEPGLEAIVEPGTWNLVVGGDNLSTVLETVEVKPNEPLVVDIELGAADGYRLATVRVTDRDDNPIDAQYTLTESMLSYEVRNGVSVVPLPVGRHSVTITAFGWTDAEATLTVSPNDDPVLTVQMHPAWGAVTLKLVDSAGKPVSGLWHDRDNPETAPLPIPAAGLPNFMQEGDHLVKVTADGYKEALVPIRVIRDDVTEVEWELEPLDRESVPTPE